VHEKFLVKRHRGNAMPVCSAEAMLEIAIKSFYVPAHVIKVRKLCSGKQIGVQKRSDQPPAPKTISVNENCANGKRFSAVRIDDAAEIVPWAESA